jgi:hypothetical protein
MIAWAQRRFAVAGALLIVAHLAACSRRIWQKS